MAGSRPIPVELPSNVSRQKPEELPGRQDFHAEGLLQVGISGDERSCVSRQRCLKELVMTPATRTLVSITTRITCGALSATLGQRWRVPLLRSVCRRVLQLEILGIAASPCP